MIKKQAELLAKGLNELLVGENIILVTSYEWEDFFPKHVSTDIIVTEIFPEHYMSGSTLSIKTGPVGFVELDDPVIDGRAVTFVTKREDGQKIFRSFVLAREWNDVHEMTRWIVLKHGLI